MGSGPVCAADHDSLDLKQFIFQESLGNHQFNYMDEDGTSYSRQEFEDQLPFLYYRNLERRNLLPISIDGQLFDTQDIAKDRQGIEIMARHLRGHFPQIQLYPLFNNNPEVAMMRFPVEMFRFTDRAMNADYQPIRRYELSRADHTPAWLRYAREFLFPFQLTIDSPYRGQAAARIELGGLWSLAGILMALTFFFLLFRKKYRIDFSMLNLAAVLLGGFYGLAATFLNRDE
jgi:hypothetical protein